MQKRLWPRSHQMMKTSISECCNFLKLSILLLFFSPNLKKKCGRQSYFIPNFTSPSINSVNDFPLDSNIMLCRNNSELSKILSQKPPFVPCMPFLDPLFLFWAHFSFFGPTIPFLGPVCLSILYLWVCGGRTTFAFETKSSSKDWVYPRQPRVNLEIYQNISVWATRNENNQKRGFGKLRKYYKRWPLSTCPQNIFLRLFNWVDDFVNSLCLCLCLCLCAFSSNRVNDSANSCRRGQEKGWEEVTGNDAATTTTALASEMNWYFWDISTVGGL